MTSNPAFLFARGCQSIGSSTPAMLPADIGIEMLAGSPLFRGVSGHRWKSPSSASVDPTEAREEVRKPNTPSCQAKVRVGFLTWTDAPASSASDMIGGTTDDRGSGRVRADGGVVPWSVTSLTEGVLKTMFLTKLKAGAVVLLASCTMASLTTLATERAQAGRDDGRPIAAIAALASASPVPPQDPAAVAAPKAEKLPAAGGDGVVQCKGRILTPDGKLMYVNVYSTDPDADQKDLFDFADVFVMPRLWRIKGMGILRNLGNRTFAMRVCLNPDRMRAYNLSSEDIMKAFSGCGVVGSPGRLGQATGKMSQSKEYVLTYIGRYNKPEQYKNIILKANPDGEILRLKDVGEVELGTQLFDIDSDVDGRPSAAFVLNQAPGFNAGEVIEAIKEELEQTKKESFPPGMNFEVIPLDSRDMIYAVIETPRGSTLEYTSAKCHELGAIARGIDGITSVSSLAGYQIRTEGRGSDAGTCLIHLKDQSGRKRTSRQIIETLEEKCRTMNVHLEFFEPPAVSVFVAAGGFSVRVLDGTNSHSDRRPGSGPETFMDDLLKRKNLEGLFTFLAGHYPQSELVINNDAAMQKGVSIADAMENLPVFVGGDVQAERTFRRLAEELSNLFVKNDRGEMVPYSSFLQLKKKQGLNEIDR
jgi:AcrB/AcrD/AcrF family